MIIVKRYKSGMKLNLNKLLTMKKILTIIFILITSVSFAQQEQQYVLHSTNPDIDLSVYENAVESWGKLDYYRLLNERRTILYFGVYGSEGVTIELFSAQELLDDYDTQISPYTIINPEDAKETVFVLTPDKLSINPKTNE